MLGQTSLHRAEAAVGEVFTHEEVEDAGVPPLAGAQERRAVSATLPSGTYWRAVLSGRLLVQNSD
jgi:hypothetical protein